MKAILCSMLMALLLVSVAKAVDPIEFENAAEEARFQSLTKELRCLVCQNESLADSSAGLAMDLRQDVILQIRQGRSDEQIKAYLTARYGDFILYKPPVKPRTYLLWFGPVLMLLVAGIVLFRLVRGRGEKAAVNRNQDPVSGDWQ